MKKIVNWQIAGFAFTASMGTFFHFLFDLTKESVVAAFISPVNESIWEHIKLLFFPMFLFALFEYAFWGQQYAGFWCIKLKGIVVGMLLIPVLYYTYSGIIGRSVDWVNIVIFFVAVGVVYFLETKLFLGNTSCKFSSEYAFVILCVIGIVFFVFTFYPPHIPLFQDSMSKTYGF